MSGDEIIHVDPSAVATEVVRMQIARIDVIDVQRTDLEQLHLAATDAASNQGWFLFCLGMLIPTVISACATDWASAAPYVPGVYIGSSIALGLGSLILGTAWWNKRQTASAKYDSIIGMATVEVRQRIKR